jgi:hypothetical protein
VLASGFADGVRANGAGGGATLDGATADGVTLSIDGSFAIDEKASEPPNQIAEDGRKGRREGD